MIKINTKKDCQKLADLIWDGLIIPTSQGMYLYDLEEGFMFNQGLFTTLIKEDAIASHLWRNRKILDWQVVPYAYQDGRKIEKPLTDMGEWDISL